MFPSNLAIMTNQNTIAGLGVTINSELQLSTQKQELQDLLHLDSLDLHCSRKYTISVHNPEDWQEIRDVLWSVFISCIPDREVTCTDESLQSN